MSEWDVDKIRWECLKLLGWTKFDRDTVPEDTWEWYIRDKCGEIWKGPDEEFRHTTQVSSCDDGEMVPCPTRFLDHALPLMERYDISPFRTHDGMWAASKPCCRAAAEAFENVTYEEQVANHPALAICLVALRCAGRDLDDFKVKP